MKKEDIKVCIMRAAGTNCDENCGYADGKYPVNPNGAFHDIAGICNPAGTVFGLMPHPERAYYGWQLPD